MKILLLGAGATELTLKGAFKKFSDHEKVMPNDSPAPLFYIQDTRAFHGNAVVWWGPKGGGYTSRIYEAGRYTEAEARSWTQRHTDAVWPCDVVDKLWRQHVDAQDLPQMKDDQRCGASPPPPPPPVKCCCGHAENEHRPDYPGFCFHEGCQCEEFEAAKPKKPKKKAPAKVAVKP